MGKLSSMRDPYRTLETACIVLFMLATVVLVAANPSPGLGVVEGIPPNEAVEAYAYAMPQQGWAPLTVYFSPFGSHAKGGRIVRYEWDLDANGRYDTDATGAGGYASYTYKKSGTYKVTLRVTDDWGHTATASATVRVRYPGSSSVDYWTVFDDRRVRRVELRIAQAEWERMWQVPEAKARARADILMAGELVRSVAVSMKGNASLTDSGRKKSWKIDTDYYVAGQEYRNLKQLLFHNNYGDPSLLREKMAYDMMAFAGVPASHTAYVELWVDIVDDGRPSEYWGLYTMVERVDAKFVANRFDKDLGIGNLYKADAWFEEGAADLAYYGPDIESYPRPRGAVAYGLETNTERPDYADIIRLCEVIDGVDYETPQEFAAALEGALNVDGYLRYLAVIFTNLNLDTYPYTGNNYYLYDDPASGRFEFLPWDLNNSWGHFGGDARFPLYGEPCCLGPLAWAPLFTRVFQVQRYRQDYAAYVDLLVRNWFNAQNLGRQAAAWQALIGPYLTRAGGDKMYVGPEARFSVDQFTQSRLQLVSLTQERSEYLRAVLDSGQWLADAPKPSTEAAKRRQWEPVEAP